MITIQKAILSAAAFMLTFGALVIPATSVAAVTTSDVVRGSAEETELAAAFRFSEKRLEALTKHGEIQKVEEISENLIRRVYYKRNGRGKLALLGRFHSSTDAAGVQWTKGKRYNDRISFTRMQTGEYVMRNTHAVSETTVLGGLAMFDQTDPLHRAAVILATESARKTKTSRREKERTFIMTEFSNIGGLDFVLEGSPSGNVHQFEDGVLAN